ncbi:hypothetical protein CEXT_738611 [Caerostris extrusa]|uniref:Uncharacterized protein n=1 Tax=Caerostris extrusa TaxID=172846 RepID=A0AAV4WI99_CAEEX|nr:hypothetical protein CEXT_738611 [Caerostris extrusa]
MNGGGEWSVTRRWTTPFGKVHQDRVIRNLWIQCVATQSPTFPEKQSNLSGEERCARISTAIKKEDIFSESLRCICCSADWIFSR